MPRNNTEFAELSDIILNKTAREKHVAEIKKYSGAHKSDITSAARLIDIKRLWERNILSLVTELQVRNLTQLTDFFKDEAINSLFSESKKSNWLKAKADVDKLSQLTITVIAEEDDCADMPAPCEALGNVELTEEANQPSVTTITVAQTEGEENTSANNPITDNIFSNLTVVVPHEQAAKINSAARVAYMNNIQANHPAPASSSSNRFFSTTEKVLAAGAAATMASGVLAMLGIAAAITLPVAVGLGAAVIIAFVIKCVKELMDLIDNKLNSPSVNNKQQLA